MADEIAVLMHVPEIEGSSTLVGTDPGSDGSHEGWIPIESASFSFSRETTAVDPEADHDDAPEPVTRVEPITIKRQADRSSAQLLMWLANEDQTERKKEKVLIDFCSSSGKYYLRYELHGVELVSSAVSFSAPDDLSETLTLTYDYISVLQRPIDISGTVVTSKEGVAEYTVFED